MEQLLNNETALVTGAAGGIGRAIAAEIARHGARVMLADNNQDAGEAAARQLAAAGDVAFRHVDLRSRDEVDRLVAHTVEKFGRLSILVHAASPPRREQDTIFGVDDDTFDAMLAVNVTAGFRLARQTARHMIDEKISGRMLFVTSLHAHRPATCRTTPPPRPACR